jgi:hypothetical protein
MNNATKRNITNPKFCSGLVNKRNEARHKKLPAETIAGNRNLRLLFIIF